MSTDGRFEDSDLDPPCMYCRHLQTIGKLDLTGWTCAAYPEEIPYIILTRSERHVEVFPGQEGEYVFESKTYDLGKGPVKATFDGDWVPIKEEDSAG